MKTPPVFSFPKPWHTSEHEGHRVFLIAANDAVVTEINPGQVEGHVPDTMTKKAIAYFVVSLVNGVAE